MADDVNVQFGASVEGALAGLNKVTDGIASLTGPLDAIVGHAKEAGEAIAAAFAIEKIASFVERMGELGEKTERTAVLLGVTTEYVGRLNAISALTGTDVGAAALALERLQVNLQHAQDPSSTAAKALQALGLSARDLIGIPLPQQLDLLADRSAKFADGGNKTAIMFALLGRGASGLIPAMADGAHGLENLGAAADRAGTAMNEATTKGFKETHDKTVELGLSFEGVAITIFNRLKPAIDGMQQTLIQMVQGFNNALQASGTLSALLDGVRITVQVLASAFVVLVQTVRQLWDVLNLASDGLVIFSTKAGQAITALATGHFAEAKKAVTTFPAEMAKAWDNYTAAVKQSNTDAAASLKTIWTKAGTEVAAAIAKPGAPALNIVDKNGVKAAIKEIDGELAVLKQGFEQKKLLIDGDLAQHAITEDQKFAQTQQATEREYQAERDLLQRKMAIGGLDRAQKQDVLNQIALLEAKHRTDMVRLDQQSIAARQRLFEQFGSTIQGAWDNQLRGLITGQTSWAQAFKNITLDLTIEFIKFAEKTVVQWAAAQAAKLTATQTGAAAQAAAEVGGAESTLPARVAKFTSDITADAAAVFAGIFANLAPLLGPGAAAPAAAGQATTLSQLANVPKFETGAWRIPRIMPAILHPGERVLNAKEAAQSRGEAGGGAGGNVIHLSFLDGSQAQSFVERHAGALAYAVAGYQKANPSARGKW